jgi:hypothetical protein
MYKMRREESNRTHIGGRLIDPKSNIHCGSVCGGQVTARAGPSPPSESRPWADPKVREVSAPPRAEPDKPLDPRIVYFITVTESNGLG